MWKQDKKAPIWEFLGWTFLINIISYAIIIIGERTGILADSMGNTIISRINISSVIDTFIGGFSPLYAAYIVLKRHNDILGVGEFIKRIFRTPNIKKTIIITSAFCFAKLIPAILEGERTDNPWYIIIPAIPLMILGGGLEEVGWRGFLQPAFEKRMKYIPAVLVVTVFWFAWHIPLFFLNFSNQTNYDLLPFLLNLTAGAFASAAIYKVSKSTIACVMLHAWGNAIGALYDWSMFATFPISKVLLAYYCIAIIASITINILVARKEVMCSYGNELH